MAPERKVVVRPVRTVRYDFRTLMRLGCFALGLSAKAQLGLKLLGAGNCARDVRAHQPIESDLIIQLIMRTEELTDLGSLFINFQGSINKTFFENNLLK